MKEKEKLPSILDTLSDSINVILNPIRNWLKRREKNEKEYWEGRLGKKFDTYTQMCGARDEHLDKLEIKKIKAGGKDEKPKFKNNLDPLGMNPFIR